MSTCHPIQNDLDCFLLACNHGKLKVLRELVNRHNMDAHVVNEVCVCVCVYIDVIKKNADQVRVCLSVCVTVCVCARACVPQLSVQSK